jgi:arylsulfatase A-like enzyme
MPKTTRRSFLKAALSSSPIVMAPLSMFGRTAPHAPGGPRAAARPNFLFLLTDDQTYRSIRALNNEEVRTPAMDKLVKKGVTFTHTFNQGSWVGAVCVASRTMLLTGQTVFRAARNVRYLDSDQRLYGPSVYQLKKKPGVAYEETEVKTWAEVFSAAGYHTFITGKWHNSPYALLKGFDEGHCVGDGMYETFDEKGSSALAYGRPNGSPWVPWDPKYGGHWRPQVKDILHDESGVKTMGAPYTVEEHTSALYADRAIDFLQTRARNPEKPFFMYVAFNAPHDPRQSIKEFVEMYPREKIEIPENFLPEHPFDQGDHRIRDEKLAPFPRTKEAVQLHRQEYYGILSHLDHQIGRILTALEKTGADRNTYVVLTSDQGLAVGQHGLMGKQNQYDHSVRMPFTIAGPGIAEGRRLDHLVYMQSVFATSCDLAGIAVPSTVEFSSLKPLLEGNPAGGEAAIFGCYRHFQRMIRSREHKLIVYPEVKKAQLFDLERDPMETRDVAGEPGYRDIKARLLQELVNRGMDLGDFLLLNPSEY